MVFGLIAAAVVAPTMDEGAPKTAPELLLKLPLLLEFGICSGFGGPADCHRIIRVDIMGGLTGLLSNMRSNSSITGAERRGRSWNGGGFGGYYLLYLFIFNF